jgi:hypothetical protein
VRRAVSLIRFESLGKSFALLSEIKSGVDDYRRQSSAESERFSVSCQE